MNEAKFKKIVIPYAIDIIAERFDNILELMHPNAFVYGGAIRDIVAGLPLEGDLDIVASGADYDYCYSKIIACGKWRQCYTNNIDRLIAKVKGQVSGRENKAIRHVNYFETFNHRRVELVKANTSLSKNITSSMEVVRTVDIVCCGLAMDIYGNIYEVAEGAYQDCMDKILRLHNLDSTMNIEVLKDRIAKLEKRGWTSKINIDKATRSLEKVAKAAEREQKRRLKGKHNHRYMISSKVKVQSDGELLVLFDGIRDSLKVKPARINSIINGIMRRIDYTLPYHVNFAGAGSLCITLNFRSIVNAKIVAKKIRSEITAYLQSLNSYNVSSPIHKQKAKRLEKKYNTYISTKLPEVAEMPEEATEELLDKYNFETLLGEDPLVDKLNSETPTLSAGRAYVKGDGNLKPNAVVPEDAPEFGLEHMSAPEHGVPHSHGGEIASNTARSAPIWKHITEPVEIAVESYPIDEVKYIKENPGREHRKLKPYVEKRITPSEDYQQAKDYLEKTYTITKEMTPIKEKKKKERKMSIKITKKEDF